MSNVLPSIVEHLGKLKRRVTLSILQKDIQEEVLSRMRQLVKKERMPGFRPGKVPLKMIMQKYSGQTELEVLKDKLNQAFLAISRKEDLKVVGPPHFSKQADAIDTDTDTDTDTDAHVFDVTFEIYPEVKVGDITTVTITRMTTAIGEAEVDRVLDVLRKQQAHYHVRGEASEHGDGGEDVTAQYGDQVTADFVGHMDGSLLEDSTEQNVKFVLGEKRVPAEFEQAAFGLTVGESRTFDLKFPDNEANKERAGKTAQFTLTIRKIEWPHYPEIDADFSKLLGIADGDIATLRAEISSSLEHEAKHRSQLLLKREVMDALLKISEFDIPETLVEQEQHHLMTEARQSLKQRGVPNAAQTPMPVEIFKALAQRRVKLGLVLAEWVKQYELQAKPEQIGAKIEELVQNYKDPIEGLRWYYSDQKRLAEIEALVIEHNVADFVLSKVQVNDKQVSFEELANATAH